MAATAILWFKSQIVPAGPEHDLEGVVAKRKFDPYSLRKSGWLKIRNRHYSQWICREQLFDREREIASFQYWNNWVRVCESLD